MYPFVSAGYSHLRSPAVCGTTRDTAAECGRDEASPPPAAPPTAGFIHLRSPVYQLKESKTSWLFQECKHYSRGGTGHVCVFSFIKPVPKAWNCKNLASG